MKTVQTASKVGHVRLFTIPGSHPGVSVQRMLEHKAIPYKRTDLLPVVSWVVLRALRFPGVRVPAIKIDGRRVQGSIEITRELERIEPQPPLFPADPDRRSAVEEAERFGDEELQNTIRQIFLWSGSAGNSGGCGTIRSSSRVISTEPWTLRPSILIAGTRTPGNRSALSTTHETTGSRSVRL